MAWLQVEWQLTIEKPNEYNDEPGLRLALIGLSDGLVQIHAHSTGLLDRVGVVAPMGDSDVWSGVLRQPFPLPTEENPYFAFAVQVFEHDRSTVEDRRRDDKAFADSLELVCQEVVDSGGLPQSGVLWAAANAPRLIIGAQGVDDWIGASAWVDVDFGRRISPKISTEDLHHHGEEITVPGGFARKAMRFPYGDAVYVLEWERCVRAGPVDGETPAPNQMWANASWVR